ncbi:hypothetical protein Tco_0553954 [Tanacetum coccineum]
MRRRLNVHYTFSVHVSEQKFETLSCFGTEDIEDIAVKIIGDGYIKINSYKSFSDRITIVSERLHNSDPILDKLKSLQIYPPSQASPILTSESTEGSTLSDIMVRKKSNAAELCGFVTILCGNFLLHKTKDMADPPARSHACSDSICTVQDSHCRKSVIMIEQKRNDSSEQ